MIREIIKNGVSYCNYSDEDLLSVGFTQSELDVRKHEERVALVQGERKKAYTEESDPLYLEWQYDQTAEKEQVWRDKVAEIKARYPLPAETA
ncbi:hypothetical protein NOK64_24035 [Vibrio parahaemolyticus]|uniref:hypothetical protein n=1 Tax=Vibrio parahaemolyticus TaxID=670 RepID=UPI00226A8DEF|nr:hypothetical protein [Vibrio parahaemolyticus]MCX8758904.1 hypothetical protein [Vibrio parahaemolyticus]